MTLFREGRIGDLVASNLGIIRKMANRYAKGRKSMVDDLIQEGAIGLMTAAEGWDPDTGFRFSTYYQKIVERLMVTHIRRSRRAVMIPNTTHARVASAILYAGAASSPEELVSASKTKMTGEMSTALFALLSMPDAPLFKEHDGEGEYEWLASNDNQEEALSEAQEAQIRRVTIELAMVGLDDRERAVIEGMVLSDSPIGCVELAARMHVSRQRVHQVFQKAMDKIVRAIRNPGSAAQPPMQKVRLRRLPETKARLTTEAIRDIRAAREAGESRKSLALRYGISEKTVWKLMTGRTWSHVA